ncbi:hypothetical protein [Burkholderia vietnamiensis]|uniref:hypothetical protein n=1 Tax=Burkholderia vietnamiensis TaxID=60552 RepID=UPI001CF12009|nr:hypothetical protein [Burkholderia vietnamiensis]MCA8448978.1 hypothetical protein [Burkholderia vietnamiensis]
MDDFNFNTLHDHDGEQHDHLDNTGSAGGESAPLLDTHTTDTPEVTSTKGKHGKKHQDEPAPAVVETVDTGDVDLSKPLAPTHDENKGFMRYLPELLKVMNRKGVPFTLNGATGEIQVSGFYKAGGVTLEIGDDDTITAVDRRARNVVATYDDLVRLNYDWWVRSNGRGELLSPDRPWLDAFLEKGWIKRVVIFVPRDGGAPGNED